MPGHPIVQSMYSSWDGNFQHFEQENYNMHIHPHAHPHMPENYADFPDPSQMHRGPLKRSYSETIPYGDKPFKKGRIAPFSDEQEEVIELPSPEEMPHVADDGQKPPYSYAQMIGMAILRSPQRRLTLASIYEWISTTFRYYREESKIGWHNSIRHNLSLNKAFIKQERPKSDAGKGCYWAIKPGSEAQFFKDKPRKNTASMSMPMQQSFNAQPSSHEISHKISEAVQPQPWLLQSQPIIEPAPSIPPPLKRAKTEPVLDSNLPELSSDATLPASDPALEEESTETVVQGHSGHNSTIRALEDSIPDFAPPSMPAPPSSPPLINSSPPVMPRTHTRTISSPSNLVRDSIKRSKAAVNGMDDSGYFSSLESSARRPRHGGIIPTSELGFVPTKKVGRAEEEIARIRSSSRDITPSGRRLRRAATDIQRTSSPTRSPIEPPATPPVIFKKPALPPQSISPNTQLKRHREAMSQFIGGSPGKLNDPFGTELDIYSPAFKIGTPGLVGSHSFDDSFLSDFVMPGTPVLSSPLKPTRKALQRSHTSAGVLNEVTQKSNAIAKINGKTPTKIPGNIVFKAPTPPLFGGSPLKKGTNLKAVDLFNDENDSGFFDFDGFPDENSEEGEELDISKGFSKIGSKAPNLNFGKSFNSGSRPALARSFTSRF